MSTVLKIELKTIVSALNSTDTGKKVVTTAKFADVESKTKGLSEMVDQLKKAQAALAELNKQMALMEMPDERTEFDYEVEDDTSDLSLVIEYGIPQFMWDLIKDLSEAELEEYLNSQIGPVLKTGAKEVKIELV